MNRALIIAATTTAGAVLVTGLLAGPALALGRGPGGGLGAGFGGGLGAGAHRGPGAGWQSPGQAVTDPLAGLAQGDLTAGQKTALAGMAEEEKLAHDVYVTLAATSGDARFSRIAASEARHVTEVRALLTRYGVADPTAGKAEGVFATPAVQKLHDDLVARGDDSLDAALAVGRDIERLDIADLTKAGAGVTAPDVTTVYRRLSSGSENHLRAFSR
jgi:hypothetical protein